MHAISKIIAKHANLKSVEVGEIVNVTPDYVMLNDRGAARAADLLRKMGGDKVFSPEQIVVVFDHHYPPIRQQDSVSQKRTREWIKEQGITRFHAGEGIGHVIFPEKGYAFPGALIFGTDSHTVTNSALGCLATGLGHSDIASYLALGYNWLRVPEVIRFNLHGEFKAGVCAKDIALRIAQLYGEDAAPYLGVEFSGPLTAKLPMSERLVLCNMVIDFGAKTGYIQPDDTTARFMAQRAPSLGWIAESTNSDSDCNRIVDLDVGEINSLVAIPHDLSDIRSASTLSDVRIDEAIFGTCTGGRIDDFRIAASLLNGRKLAPHTRMMVNPGSREVYLQAIREGIIDVMVEAGATVGVPGCGPCSGCHQGMLAPAENAITNASRNFRGRFGSPEANAYVASSATVVASAIAGRIASPGRIHEALDFAMLIKGRTWVFGRHVNTDLIFPKMWFRPTYEPGEMASHLMVGLDEDFPDKVRRGDIIVGGLNFGCGSSREEAAAAMKEAGIAAVVAPSFGRIYTRNCINVGLPIVVSPGIDEQVTQGDQIEIDLANGFIRNLRSGYYARLPPMAAESLQLIQDGGIANYTRRILEERRKATTRASN